MRHMQCGNAGGARARRRDSLAVAAAALASLAVLWFGGGVASGLAVRGVIGAPQTHAELASRARETRPASYGDLFAHAVAPVRTDVAASLKAIRLEARDLFPPQWGWGHL